MSLLRAARRCSAVPACFSQYGLLSVPSTGLRPFQLRTYAKRNRNDEHSRDSTANLVPKSEMPMSSEAGSAEYKKCDEKMVAAVEWFRRDSAIAEQRASGRVTPALLDPVRVALKDLPGQKMRLAEIATVGVKDSSVIVVTAFDANNLKDIESAIYDAKLPGITPQRVDERTLRIPMPKPTVEARQSIYTTAAKTAEEARVQLRHHHNNSMKKFSFKKGGEGYEAFKKLLDKHIGMVDTILAGLKKSTGTK